MEIISAIKKATPRWLKAIAGFRFRGAAHMDSPATLVANYGQSSSPENDRDSRLATGGVLVSVVSLRRWLELFRSLEDRVRSFHEESSGTLMILLRHD